jgi:outer membrane biosynthesis protein TonB
MYFIIEIQANKTGEQAAIAPILGYTDKDKAISAFYYKLVYAADPDLSKVEKHTVMLIDHLGQTLMHNVFEHEFPAPEPEPEPTPDPEPEEDAPAEEPEEVEEEPIEEPVEEPTGEQEEPEDVGSL